MKILKKILIFVTIIGTTVLIVEFTKSAKEVEVKDRLITKMASGLDLDSYSIFPSQIYANIEGEVLNKSDRQLIDATLVYQVGNDTLIVVIDFLSAKDKASFKTKEFKVSSASTEYTLLEVNLND
ncbi:MAG: hypothetical protein HKM87_10720 [Ignavibacteriaceae bacterium]|nr:hypothetical protein [Ignavibacteriaceae bacterium]